MNPEGVLKRLEQSLKLSLGATREHLVLSGFDVYLSASAEAHMSCAVPRLTPHRPEDIQELLTVFRQRQKQPRLEYFPELHPLLKPLLETQGFVQEMSAPVMVLLKQNLTEQEATEIGEYHILEDKDDLLKTFLRRQSLAFGGLGDDSSLSWLASLQQGLREGSVTGSYLEHQHEMVSGAIIQGKKDGELAGVWTLPGQQRQGFGHKLCQTLLLDYFAGGQSLCWLSAAEGAQKLYKNLGFKVVGTQLNMVLPDAGPHR